jgi:ketosteroid isomerase-like protein
MMGVHQGSTHLLLLISLFFVVLGSLMLTVLVLTTPWVKRPQIIRQKMRRPVPSIERKEEPTIPMAVEAKRMEKEPLEAVTEESGKTPAEETGYRDVVFRRKIFAGDTKVIEEKPTAISVEEKQAASEFQEKSEKGIPQPPSIAPKVAALEKGREAAEPRIPEPQEKQVGSEKDTKVDGRAPSSVKASSPVVESETVMSEKKSLPQPPQLSDSDVSGDARSLKKRGAPSDPKGKGISVARPTKSSSASAEGEDRVIRPKLPSPIATGEEVRQFFVDYVERYNRKDIDGFLSLFSPKAIQNHREGFDDIRRIYSDFFKKSRKLRYRLEDMKIKVNQNVAEARGHYTLVQKQKRRWKEKVWKGDIRWVLIRENGALKIRYLDYTPEKSP